MKKIVVGQDLDRSALRRLLQRVVNRLRFVVSLAFLAVAVIVGLPALVCAAIAAWLNPDPESDVEIHFGF